MNPALTEREAQQLANIYQQHFPVFTYNDLDYADASGRGVFGSLVRKQVLTRFDPDEAALLTALKQVQDEKRFLSTTGTSIQKYELDVPGFDTTTFSRLTESDAINSHAGLGYLTDIADDIVAHQDRLDTLYTISQHHRARLPLYYRHPTLLDTYNDLRATHGDPADIIILGGRTKTGTSHLADMLGDALDIPVYHGSQFFRQLATDTYAENLDIINDTSADTTPPDEDTAVAVLEHRIEQDRDGLAQELGADPDVYVEIQGYEELFTADGPLIMESRLAPWYIPDQATLQINVTSSLNTAATRLAADPDWGGTVDAARDHITGRRDRLRTRYYNRYGIDIADTTVFDKTIDNDTDLDTDLPDGRTRRDQIIDQVEHWINTG